MAVSFFEAGAQHDDAVVVDVSDAAQQLSVAAVIAALFFSCEALICFAVVWSDELQQSLMAASFFTESFD
ncbi:hypothetical protein GCM10022277_18840 [Litoribacillus peritrichatus]|uniref:Uncharacterized protein n=1 Tax=Litoribacillus peritrichatus TaxID=718191 RepID=A0ABP7MHP4_9GAMM